MENQDEITATIIMKREDGLSILDAENAIRSGSAHDFDVSPERAQEIRQRLESFGFTIQTGNLNSLSVSGCEDDFFSVFGLRSSFDEDESVVNRGRIPQDLSDMIADIFVLPAPTLFP